VESFIAFWVGISNRAVTLPTSRHAASPSAKELRPPSRLVRLLLARCRAEKEIAMEDTLLVRELTARERDRLAAAKTGDRLSDGSVLLRRRDMNRMGLNGLREWIRQRVLAEGSPLAFFDETGRPCPH
jgi:hypothetical protein